MKRWKTFLCIVLLVVLSSCEKSGSEAKELEKIGEIYRDIYEEAEKEGDVISRDTIKSIVNRLGEQGYCAVDFDNEVNMVNQEQAEKFLEKAEGKEEGEWTLIQILDNGGLIKYDFHTSKGEIKVVHSVLNWKEGSAETEYQKEYQLYSWKYTENGYFFFEEYHPSGYDGPSGHTAVRIGQLDERCREFNHEYVRSIGYNLNNMFITDWSGEDYGELDFYDLYEILYQMYYEKTSPYEFAYEGNTYEIPEKEFEEVIMAYFQIDSIELRKKTSYNGEKGVYEYPMRGFEDGTSSPDIPYPEVTGYRENADGTIALTVHAVWTGRQKECVFTHVLTVRPLAEGRFQYVSNSVVWTEDSEEPCWYKERRR